MVRQSEFRSYAMKLRNLPIRLTVTGAFIISMTLAVFFVA